MLGEAMEREIREQSERLPEGAKRYADFFSQRFKPNAPEIIVIAARGSSDNAALYGRYLFEIHLRIPVCLAAPSVLTKYHAEVRYPKALGIGISQSGAAPDVAEVLAAMRTAGHQTLAITNTVPSNLSNVAQFSLSLEVGVERSVAATKTVTASMTALYELARSMTTRLPTANDTLPGGTWQKVAQEWAVDAAPTICASSAVFSLGRGYGFSTAQECALKLMECALISCKPYSVADFEHGPKALAVESTCAISFVGPISWLAAQGCRVLTPPAIPPDVTEEIAPLWHLVCAQWLALESARLKRLDPDAPKNLSKVTKTL